MRDIKLPPRSGWRLPSSGSCEASSGNSLPKFRDKLLVPHSRVKKGFLTLEGGSITGWLTINEHKTKYLRCKKKQNKTDGIDITQTHLEQVKSFKYLGSIVNGNNSVEEEIKGRISPGNKAFYANQDLFKSKLLAKNSKLRMYKTLVRPVATCACETWVLKGNIKTKLRVFERKVLRRIYGPTKEKDGTWIKSNEELYRLTGNKNINYIKAQNLAWFGDVHRMPDNSMVKKSIWVVTRTNKIARKTKK